MLRPLNDCYCALRVQGLVLELVTHRIFYSWWKWFGLTRSRDQCFDSRNVVLAFVGQGPIGITHRVSQGTSWVIRMVRMLTWFVLRTYLCPPCMIGVHRGVIPMDGGTFQWTFIRYVRILSFLAVVRESAATAVVFPPPCKEQGKDSWRAACVSKW